MVKVIVLLSAAVVSWGSATTIVAQDSVLKNAEAPTEALQSNLDQVPESADLTEAGAESAEAKESQVTSQSVTVEVQSSSDSNAEESPAKNKVTGKVMIIGPDGQKQEYLIDAGQPAIPGRLGKLRITEGKFESERDEELAATKEEERWVIGVQCEEAGDLLRTHLKLGIKGLVVRNVREETPAAEAGLKVADILVRINERDLSSRDDLMDSVLSSEGAELTVSVIRAGDPLVVKVTPKKMMVPVVMEPASKDINGLEIHMDLDSANGPVRLERIHPGVLIEGALPGGQGDIDTLLGKLREMAAQQSHEGSDQSRIVISMPNKADSQPDSQPDRAEKVSKKLSSLQDQIKTLQEQVAELQKEISKNQKKSE